MAMKLISDRDVIRGVLDRWIEQYGHMKPTSLLADGRSVAEIKAALSALDLETCSRDDVDNAIGNPSWTKNECDHCGRHVAVLVRYGDEPDYDAHWHDLCLDCLEAGVRVIKG